MNELAKCLCCESALLPLIDFGPMPLVNTYDVTDKFPLAVNRCVSCCHLQLSEFVDPDILYRDYAYMSGTGETARDFFTEFARIALSYFPTARTVLDIACNDGSQLDAFKEAGLKTFGIDPAENLADISTAKGHEVCSLFFEETKADQQYDIITAQNVIAHTPDPLKFLVKCADIMHDNSRLFIVTSQANMIVNGECDTIYHEHVSYFNAHSMEKLATKSNLDILDVIIHPIHGTSFIFVLSKKYTDMTYHRGVSERLDWEFVTGMMAPPIYRWWKTQAESKIKRVGEVISYFTRTGVLTAGCGAAAKGISMLNMAGVKLDVIYDNTPTKWNKMTNGMFILPFEDLSKVKANQVAFVILAWNLREEIRRNVLKLRNNPKDAFLDTR